MRKLHNRMPAILPRDVHDAWLDVDRLQGADAQALLKPCAADALALFPVSRYVNNARNDDAACIAPQAGQA